MGFRPLTAEATSRPVRSYTQAGRSGYNSCTAIWNIMIALAIQQPVGEFRAYVEFANDPEFAALTGDR